MRCPKCGVFEDKVIDSREAKDGTNVRRRRQCVACGFRFTTYEEVERRDIRILKRDRRVEPFDRHKLLGGMTKACEKRPVSTEALEKAVAEIIQEIEQSGSREVPAHLLGSKAMEKLHQLVV